tara:strand:- start:454 stop:603 length:150 start_codon:yes stop_codon:yes gene_type:complete
MHNILVCSSFFEQTKNNYTLLQTTDLLPSLSDKKTSQEKKPNRDKAENQ